MTIIHYKLTDEELAAKRSGRPAAPNGRAIIPSQPIKPMPADSWPVWAKTVARLKSDEDMGVGDTIRRQVGIFGAGFKAAMLGMGVPCGCDARQDEYNTKYPYARGI